MVRPITNPLAEATVQWLSPEQGGRAAQITGRFAATCAFGDGDDSDDYESWLLGPDDLSIIIEPIGPLVGGRCEAWLDFIAPDLAAPRVRDHDRFVVLDGSRTIAYGTITARHLDSRLSGAS
jgi:hypothetical protein